MIAVDSNILVYAHRVDSEFHRPAVDAVKGLAEGKRSWALLWPCVHEFLAIATHPRIYDPPSPVGRATAQVEAWLDSPTVVLVSEGLNHWRELATMVMAGAIGPRVHDARIAALCHTTGVTELWSADRDFSRFNLNVTNPLLR